MTERGEQVDAALMACFGEPQFSPGQDPVDTLVGTILSANTNDRNSDRAFQRLKDFSGGDWEMVRTAPLEVIKELIRTAGMYNQKAPHIVATLERIRADFGRYNLDHLATDPLDAAMLWLTSLPGVGHKTASIVLLFCFNRAAFPVDTHIQRITQRLGFVAPKASTEAIKRMWEAEVAPERFYPLHINLIRLGREFCKPQHPRCEVCPLQPYCAWAHATRPAQDAKKPPAG